MNKNMLPLAIGGVGVLLTVFEFSWVSSSSALRGVATPHFPAGLSMIAFAFVMGCYLFCKDGKKE